ncbi:hypothetical protein ONS96_009140 [Cadophora gregata f. sp. sojae]|nr:hypothetical protein ONS96_009140 [Cadophora gregata f. sp. sojae]
MHVDSSSEFRQSSVWVLVSLQWRSFQLLNLKVPTQRVYRLGCSDRISSYPSEGLKASPPSPHYYFPLWESANTQPRPMQRKSCSPACGVSSSASQVSYVVDVRL